ncbi:hypothetical protein BD414DRAFT_173997 [Trametes punicea]|nr:hypothetical protein BD414DRAFT_173997 [Trametes punicea]
MGLTEVMSLSPTDQRLDASHPYLPDGVLQIRAELSPHLEDNHKRHDEFEAGLNHANPDKEIRRLNKTIEEIEQTFAKLSRAFGRHDKEAERLGVQWRDGPLRVRWDELRTTFEMLLHDSRQNASGARAVLMQYVNLFTNENLSDSTLYDAIKTEIKNLLVMVYEKAEQARDFEDRFKDLAESVRDFDTYDLRDALRDAGVQAQRLREDITAARQHVQELYRQVAETSKEMTNMGLACLSCLSTAAVSAGVFLFKLSPEAATTAMGSVLAAIPFGARAVKKWKEKKRSRLSFRLARNRAPSLAANLDIELRKDIVRLENSIRDLEGKSEGIDCLQYRLLRVGDDIDGVASKIATISGIWHAIKTDMQDFHAQLETVVCGDRVTSLFLQKLKITRAVYCKLIDVLSIYGRTSSDEGSDHDFGDELSAQ